MNINLINQYLVKTLEHQIELDTLRERLGVNFVIADIGAANGLDSLKYSKQFPDATIHSFEPEKRNYEALVALTRECPRIMCYNIALGDANLNGVDFFVSDGYLNDEKMEENRGDKSSSLLQPKEHLTRWSWIKFEKTNTNVRRFDCMGINDIDFVHMDVQGYELKVLSGFGTLLNRVQAVWMEVSRVPLYLGQPLRDDVMDFMREKSFTLKKDAVSDFTGNQFYIKDK
jgi:FkbM family methyltransferase